MDTVTSSAGAPSVGERPVSVSVVVPCWNTRPQYLHACIESIPASTRSCDVEVVIVDDGSAGWCIGAIRQVVDRFKWSGKSVSAVLDGRHRGMAGARNHGAAVTSGEFIVFLDSDDMLAPKFLSRLEPHLRESSTALCYGDHVNVSTDGKRELLRRRKSPYATLTRKYADSFFNPFFHATFLIHPQIVRREAFFEIGGLDTEYGYGDEVEMHIQLCRKFGAISVTHVDEILYRYRNNTESVVHQPVLYHRLIANIESILLRHAREYEPSAFSCERIGRAANTHAAHYKFLTRSGKAISVPYFNFETNCLVE